MTQLELITKHIESCFAAVGEDFEMASTENGIPALRWAFGVRNLPVDDLFFNVGQAIARDFQGKYSNKTLRWRQRPLLREWTDDVGTNVMISWRIAIE